MSIAEAFTRNHPQFTLRPSLRWPAIDQMRVARYLIQLQLCNQVVPQQIRVSWTRCNYGGFRPWFHCSYCNRRIARLFKGMGGYYCRACIGNPLYESQRRSKKARTYLQAYRLRQRLGGSRPVLDPVPARPYRMKRKTYRRLCARIERLERPLIGSRVTRRTPIWIRPLPIDFGSSPTGRNLSASHLRKSKEMKGWTEVLCR
jgi:hypothetical protein